MYRYPFVIGREPVYTHDTSMYPKKSQQIITLHSFIKMISHLLNYNPIFWECTQQYTHISQNKQKEKQTNKYRNLPLSYDMEFSNIGESSVSFIVISKCVNKISFL